MAANAKSLAPGDVLVKEGDESTSMYWLQTGSLVVTKTVDGKKVTIDKIIAGQLVGEISFIDQKPRSATVSALEQSELIEIPRETFEKVFASQPAWFNALFRTLAERLRKADERIRV
jgi:CRP/FNR family transcriptional regulator, cyclic AMP receptor protein